MTGFFLISLPSAPLRHRNGVCTEDVKQRLFFVRWVSISESDSSKLTSEAVEPAVENLCGTSMPSLRHRNDVCSEDVKQRLFFVRWVSEAEPAEYIVFYKLLFFQFL